jgi:hypothetical protein
MSAVADPIEDYVCGNSNQELERLKMQARFLEKGLSNSYCQLDLNLG